MLPHHPLLVVRLDPRVESLEEFLHVSKPPSPQELLLERPDEPLRAPVPLRRADVRRARLDPEEGNLGKATEAEIAATVAQPHTYHGELALAADLVEDVAPRKSYWWIFMVAVLAVLAAENSLARRFGHYISRVPTAGSRPS